MTVNGTGGRPPLVPKLLSSTAVASAVFSLAFLCTFFFAQPAAAANLNPCSLAKGTVGAGGTFTASESGKDFKMSCGGNLLEDLTNDNLKNLLDSMTGFVEGESKVILDVRGDSSELYRIAIDSDAERTIFTGTLINSANNDNANQKDYAVITVDSADPTTNNGAIYPVVVESYATVTGKGDGRRGVVAYDVYGADVSVTNYGVITTEGDIHTRPSGTYRVRDTSGLAASTELGGNATATNEIGATITAKGLAARGMTTFADGSGDALSVNKGTVTTTGGAYKSTEPDEGFTRRPYGVAAGTKGGGSATARNEAGATITTGNPTLIATPPDGVTGIAISGTQGHGLHAFTESANAGPVSVINDGTITTYGVRAHGMSAGIDSAKTRSAASSATGTNNGTVTTHGDRSDGLRAISPFSDNIKSMASVKNTGTITTNGDGSKGIMANYYWENTSTDTKQNARGTAIAENTGTITVKGDSITGGTSIGVIASYSADENSRILDAGDVIVKNSGTVNNFGDGSFGLLAETFGSGDASIEMTDGTVVAGSTHATDTAKQKFGAGIYGGAFTANSTNDVSTDIDVNILVSGRATSVTAYGADTDDTSTSYINETQGAGVWAYTGATSGHAKVVIRDGATVSAFSTDATKNGNAVLILGGKSTVEVTSSRLVGDVKFAGKDDILTLNKSGSIDGNIDFGAGDDTLNLNVDPNQTFQITGSVTGVNTLYKLGTGRARFGGGISFQGSALNLNAGELVVGGHMNLGSGTATIKDGSRLVFEITNTTDDGYGKLTAGELFFDGTQSAQAGVYTQISDSVTNVSALRTALGTTNLTLLNVTTINTGSVSSKVSTKTLDVRSQSAGSPKVGTLTLSSEGVGSANFDVGQTNQIPKAVPVPITGTPPTTPPTTGTPPTTPPTTGATGSGGGGSSGGALLGIGVLAGLVAYFVWGNDDTTGFADYYYDKPRSAYVSMDDRGVLTVRDSGNQPYQFWIRTNQAIQPSHLTGVSGSEIGVTLFRSDDFEISTSAVPDAAGAVDSLNLSAEGSAYSMNAGWRNDRYFAGLRYSHGEYDVESVIDNPVVNSALVSKYKFRNSQTQFTAGANWTVDNIKLTPSATYQAGRFEHDPHVAYSPVLNTRIPGYSQDYTGLKLGFKVTSVDWLNFFNESVWKPHLQFDTIRTKSQRIEGLSMHQADKLGVMEFSSGANVRHMPDTINALSFGAKIKSSQSDRAQWKIGFAGFEADGEYHHAAMVGYKLKF